MSTYNQLPEQLSKQVQDKILFSMKTDLLPDGKFGEQWVAITAKEVMVWSKDSKLQQLLLIEELKEARAVHAIGGGSLIADKGEQLIVVVRYTSELTSIINYVAKLITSLANNEEQPVISERDLPKYCSNCNTPLSEGTQICQFCTSSRKATTRMLEYTKPYKLQMIIAACLLVITTIVELIPPYLTKIIIDDVLQPKDMGTTLLILIVTWGVTMLLMTVMQTIRGYIGIWVGSKLMGDIRRDIYSSLMRLSLAFFDRRQTSQFISRVNNDAESMRHFMTDGVIYVSGHVLQFLFIFIIIFTLNWELAVLALLPIPIMVIASITIWPKMGRRFYQQWRSIFRINTLVGDSLQGIRVIKAFGQERIELSRFAEANVNVVRSNIKTEGLWQLFFPFFSLMAGLGTLLIWYNGGNLVLNNELQLGVLIAFVTYLAMLFGPLQWISQMISWASRAMAASQRVFEIMDTPSEVPDHPNTLPIGKIKGDVVFDHVTYGYEKHHPVLKDINLDVIAGEMIGLVGHSGAGKSTFINLICRFYDSDEGRILIDGIPINKISQVDLRSQIGVVLQETFLFDGTIANNISYSKPDATPEEIIRAAKIANAHDFIVRLPDGYDTRVGERGHKLSGGEKQRVAIARAVIHDPRILILDEATASVDTETERQIQEALSRLVKGRTTFAIAHRLSTLRNADRLVVLEQGKFVEIGTHEQLLEKEDGVYRKLVDAQKEMSKIKGVEG